MLDGSGVVRTFKETLGVRLVRERRGLDDTRHKAGHRIDHDHRCELAAGQHEVADRQLLVDLALDHALVDALVVPAHDHEMRHVRETPGGGLIEQRALRGHEDDVAAVTLGRADRARERLGL